MRSWRCLSLWLLISTLLPLFAYAQAPPTPEGIWVNNGTFLMRFESGGGLAFEGGFDFWNPARWLLKDRILYITLGGTTPFSREGSSVASYDAATRTLKFGYPRCTKQFKLGGYIFFREPEIICLDSDYQ